MTLRSSRPIRLPETLDVRRPIFDDVPDDIDETWIHGALVGGMVSLTPNTDIGRAYRLAADALVTRALKQRLSWEVAYPILFLYRHAVELALKAASPGPMNHDLAKRLSAAIDSLKGLFHDSDLAWLRDRVGEFINWDSSSTTFRFEQTPKSLARTSRDEAWIDFRHLRDVVGAILDMLDQAR